MINQKDIDSAIRYGTERNIDKEARGLTERYLLDKLGEYIALKKIQRKSRRKPRHAHFYNLPKKSSTISLRNYDAVYMLSLRRTLPDFKCHCNKR